MNRTCFLILLMSLTLWRTAQAQSIEAVSAWEGNIGNFQLTGDTLRDIEYLDRAGDHYTRQQEFSKAITSFQLLLSLYQSDDTAALAQTNRRLGLMHAEQKDYEKSADYLQVAINLYDTATYLPEQAAVFIDLATVYNRSGRYKLAMQRLRNKLPLIKQAGDIQLIRSYYGLMAQTYQHLGETERSMEYFTYYTSIDGEIQEKENRRVLEEAALAQQQVFMKKQELAKTIEELEKVQELSQEQRSAISKLNAETALKELALSEKEARLKNEAWVRRLLTGGVILSLGMLSLLFIYFRQTKRKNTLLGQKNQEIEEQKEELLQQSNTLEDAHRELAKYNKKVMHSINYAQRIQDAMLPEESDFQQLVTDSFILFHPRDIVSGDFYWFAETFERATKNQLAFADRRGAATHEGRVLVAAMDCTGHGVPGAFMSMIGFNFLNDIEQKGIIQPNEILNTLHLSVRRFLKQDETENKDGMDAAICLIDLEEKLLTFSGANNPLVYIQEGEMHVIKGDRSAVGGVHTDRNHRFASHTVSLDKETWVYIFSDGYQDQFGGEDDRKFMSKKLRQMLFEIHRLPFSQQKQRLDQTLRQWMGNKSQVDDILVIGFKVGG